MPIENRAVNLAVPADAHQTLKGFLLHALQMRLIFDLRSLLALAAALLFSLASHLYLCPPYARVANFRWSQVLDAFPHV